MVCDIEQSRVLIWDDRSSLRNALSVSSRDYGAERAAVEVADATVDHSDIRGSSSGLAVMVMIRRELPRTKLVSWVRPFACHIVRPRVLLSVCPSPAARSAPKESVLVYSP